MSVILIKVAAPMEIIALTFMVIISTGVAPDMAMVMALTMTGIIMIIVRTGQSALILEVSSIPQPVNVLRTLARKHRKLLALL